MHNNTYCHCTNGCARTVMQTCLRPNVSRLAPESVSTSCAQSGPSSDLIFNYLDSSHLTFDDLNGSEVVVCAKK